MSPIAQCVEIADVKAVFQTLMDSRDTAYDFASHEGLTADRGLMVEEDTVARVRAVRLAVINAASAIENTRPETIRAPDAAAT